MSSNLAIFTQEQDARWSQLMEIAWGLGMSDEEASADVWQGMIKEWPELAQFDGAMAGYADTPFAFVRFRSSQLGR